MDKRKVICLAAVIAIVFFSLLALLLTGNIKNGNTACIYSGGKLVKTIDLSTAENQTFTISGEDGGRNTIEIKDGTIGVINADCPDKICVHTAYISDGVQPIVCVPNRLVIRIEASRQENSHVD